MNLKFPSTRTTFNLYIVVSLIAVIYCLTMLKLGSIESIVRTGPFSLVHLTLPYTGISWLLLGSVLYLLKSNRLNRGNLLTLGLFYLFAFIYLNVLRERFLYGDVNDYILAASNLWHGEPLHVRYLYPPLWATLLQPLVPAGGFIILVVCVVLNYLSLLALFVVLYKTLLKFCFPRNISAIVVFIVLVANAAVLRNMSYVQTNIHVLNLILLSLLLYDRNVFLSALVLSIAVHLKVSPIVFVIPFFLNKDWRWLAHFSFAFFGIVVMTSLANDWSYYPQFLSNISKIRAIDSPVFEASGIAFRDNSIDSVVYAARFFLNWDSEFPKYVAYAIKLLVALVSFRIMLGAIRNGSFLDSGDAKLRTLYNSYVILPVLMVMLFPVTWVYHYTFIIPSFILMLRQVRSNREGLAYFLSLYLVFLVPTFDVFPFSFHRIAGMILFYGLLLSASKHREQDFVWIGGVVASNR